jgi:glycosyltransferase involved in cell wall biosynthesis
MHILMICRHFPPAVSGGSRRPYLLARSLMTLGCEVTVVAPEACPDVPTVVVPHPHVDPDAGKSVVPSTVRDLRNILRTWILLPDPDVRWAVRAARTFVPVRPDWVLTTSPPESSHVAGWLLKRRLRCRWVADFRDTWFAEPLRPERQRRGARRTVERIFARRLLGAADATIAVTRFVGDEVSAIRPGLFATTIGYFAEAAADPAKLPEETVNVVHTGSFALSDPRRSIEPVLAAFEAASNPELHLYLVGRLNADEVRRAAGSPLADRITVTGALPRDRARAYQAAADVLLLVAVPGSQRVPGKIAEYQAAGRPVLAVGGAAWLAEFGLSPVDDLAAAFRDLPHGLPPRPASALAPDAAARNLLAFLSSLD